MYKRNKRELTVREKAGLKSFVEISRIHSSEEAMILISNSEYMVLDKGMQKLFNNYLLMRLGFTSGVYKNKYLDILQKKYSIFKYLLAQKIVRDTKTQKIIYPFDSLYKHYKEKDNLLIPSRYNLSDILMLEFNIKNNKLYTNKEQLSSFISATDISNFTYCPVSWAISKTYLLPKSESARIGTLLHEEHKLINYINIAQSVNINKTHNYSRYRLWKLDLDSGAKDLLNDLTDSVAVYVGLSQENGRNHYFKGKDIYVGQPDYIFFNYRTKKYFIVEEKFHETSQYEKTFFFENHLNQLSSYIYGILDYEISYGYLVNWTYEYSNSRNRYTYEPEIKQLHAKRINKNYDYHRKNLIETYKGIKHVLKEGRGLFDTSKLSPSKCISCVNYMLCVHKTKQYNEYSFPYSNKYMETKKVSMPKELKELVKKRT